MKKLLLLYLLLMAMSTEVFACDICGCGVGSYYIGILPEFSKRIIGLRYRYNSLHTHIGAGGATSYLTTQERYQTAELWGGWMIGKKFRLMASLPLSFNEKLNQGKTSSKIGLGDIAAQGFYRVFNTSKTIGSRLLVQTLWMGAGVKAPTGKYDRPDKSENAESANIFQLGTGSTDVTINAMYDLRIQDVGINTSAGYKINTTNAEGYRYGNKFNANLQAYYKFRIKNKLTIAPNAGVLFERAKKDLDNGFRADVSGGKLLLGSIGLESTFKHIAIGANWQCPVSQELAGGFVKANNRAMVHLSFIF